VQVTVIGWISRHVRNVYTLRIRCALVNAPLQIGWCRGTSSNSSTSGIGITIHVPIVVVPIEVILRRTVWTRTRDVRR
jgi:hypothetical protein